MNLLEQVLFAFWFFSPAGVANMVPIFASRIPWLRDFNAPMDFGLTFRGKRIFGGHKTWRGLIVGMLMATLTLWLQQYLAGNVSWISLFTGTIDYGTLNVWLLGPLFGLGALGGDAIESFFKRQRGVRPGHGWFPFDQIDYIIGGALATAAFVQLELIQYILLIFMWLVIHVIASYCGYLLKLKDTPI